MNDTRVGLIRWQLVTIRLCAAWQRTSVSRTTGNSHLPGYNDIGQNLAGTQGAADKCNLAGRIDTNRFPRSIHCESKGEWTQRGRWRQDAVPLEKPPTAAKEVEIEREQTAMRLRLGTNIKRLRIESGLSLRAFAMKANVSPSYLSEAERGLRGVTVDLLVRMAIGLNVSLETLFEE